jgi:hypothetical protein
MSLPPFFPLINYQYEWFIIPDALFLEALFSASIITSLSPDLHCSGMVSCKRKEGYSDTMFL